MGMFRRFDIFVNLNHFTHADAESVNKRKQQGTLYLLRSSG